MAKRSTLTTLVVALGLSSLNCGSHPTAPDAHGDPTLQGGCFSTAGVAFQTNLDATIAVGEKRTVVANVNRAASGCPAGQIAEPPFTHVEWFDSLESAYADPTIQVRLVSCTTCTPLYESRRTDLQPQLRGRALLQGATVVVLEVTGLRPGRALFILEACVTGSCGVRDARYLTVE